MLFLSRRFSRVRSAFEQTVLEGEVGDGLLEGGRLDPKIFHLGARCLACGIASKAALPGFEELLRPAVVQARHDALARQSSATLSSPRRPSSTILIFSSAEWRFRVRRRISLTIRSAKDVPGFCLISTSWWLRSARNPPLQDHIRCPKGADGGHSGVGGSVRMIARPRQALGLQRARLPS